MYFLRWGIFFLFFCQTTKALESLEMTFLGFPLKNSSQILEGIVQIHIDKAREELNRTKKCQKTSSEEVFSVMARHLDGGVFTETKFVHLLDHSQNFFSKEQRLRAQGAGLYSPYRYFAFGAGKMLGTAHLFNLHDHSYGSVFSYKGLRISSDKIDHFFQFGYPYFVEFCYKKKSISQILKEQGRKLEGGIYGLGISGIYSYADLVANFEGMRFYSHLLENFVSCPDPLASTFGPKKPLLFCDSTGKWQFRRPFSWKYYVHEGWNEIFNPNALESKKALELVKKGIRRIERRNENFNQILTKCGKKSKRNENPLLCLVLNNQAQEGISKKTEYYERIYNIQNQNQNQNKKELFPEKLWAYRQEERQKIKFLEKMEKRYPYWSWQKELINFKGEEFFFPTRSYKKLKNFAFIL